MRTSLVIPEKVVPFVTAYSVEKKIKFYTACNRLIRLGLGYHALLGEVDHVHSWTIRMDAFGKQYSDCPCGEVLSL